ncbi:MAG: phosphoribosyltransferase family protein [Candidatus Bathyarchaeia archaeon]
MSFEERVKIYKGQTSYVMRICELTRELPIRKVGKDIWIASNHNLVLGRDLEFTKRVSKELADRVSGFKPNCLFTAESKSLPLVYETANHLEHTWMCVARKERKAYMGRPCLIEKIKSITTKKPQKLVLELDEAKKLRGKRIVLIDDVVSTYGTMGGLERLARKAGGSVVCKATVWLEGPWYRGDLIYLSILPVFVTEKKYNELKEKTFKNKIGNQEIVL